jgi:hypothetical protein
MLLLCDLNPQFGTEFLMQFLHIMQDGADLKRMTPMTPLNLPISFGFCCGHIIGCLMILGKHQLKE